MFLKLVLSKKKIRLCIQNEKNLVYFVFFGGKNFETKTLKKLFIRFEISSKNDVSKISDFIEKNEVLHPKRK